MILSLQELKHHPAVLQQVQESNWFICADYMQL